MSVAVVRGEDRSHWHGASRLGESECALFVFADIKSAGIRKWLKFGEGNRRGLRPCLRLLDIHEGTIDEHMAQLGIVLEAFGFQAFPGSGTSAVRADNKTLEQRVRKIVQQVASSIPAHSCDVRKGPR